MTKEAAKRKAEKRLEWAVIAERKANEVRKAREIKFKDFDFTQPILRGHHSQRRHERMYEYRNASHTKENELLAKAKMHREKAENLLIFASRNKGDAEARRVEKRAAADKIHVVGSDIYDFCFGLGTIEKVNKKTYTIRFRSGSKFTRDKSYFIN